MTLTDQQALDLAFELFITLAPDNLSEQEMALFNQQFNDSGFVDLFDLEPETLENLDISLDLAELNNSEDEKIEQLSTNLVEAVIGAHPSQNPEPIIFAKVILSIDSEKKFSHIQWMSDLY